MSSKEINLCSLLLKEHFGDIVQDIGSYLLRVGPRTLRIISKDTKCSLTEIKKALCVMLQHNLATFIIREKQIEYKVSSSQVLLLLRYSRYIYTTKTLYGDVGELLLEEFINHGQLIMSKAIMNVLDRLQEATGQKNIVSTKEIKEKFVSLADTHFLKRCPKISKDEITPSDLAPVLQVDFDLEHVVPEINLSFIGSTIKVEESEPPPAKKVKIETERQPDEGIYWQVNFERFHQLFRDQAIVSMLEKRTDTNGSDIVRTILRLSEVKTAPNAITTNPVSRHELQEALKKDTSINEKNMDGYLSLITEDSTNVVFKCDERAGGMYSVNYNNGLKILASEIATSIVQDRFGSKCCRIFRLLLQKKYLDQKQIEEMSMIQAKDAKEFTYKMLKENFILTKEIAKTPDHAPSHTFYLFYIDLNQLCRMLLEWCYQAIYNSMYRREFEMQEHKRLLEKKQRVDAIIANLRRGEVDEAQVQEVEELITPPEKEQLKKVKAVTEKLDSCELQLDETVYILYTYINMPKK